MYAELKVYIIIITNTDNCHFMIKIVVFID